MVRSMIRRCTLGALPLCLAISLAAQKPRVATVVVTVFADSGVIALAGAEVSVPDADRGGRTDSLGEVTLREIPFGTHAIRVRLVGYTPLEAALQFHTETMTAEFRLKPASIALDTVRVSKTRVANGLEEFESRRALGLGRFLTQQDLDRARTDDFQTLVAARFPGVTAVFLATGERVLATTRGSCGADTSRMPRMGGRSGGAVSRTVDASRASPATSCGSGIPCVVPTLVDGEDVRGADALLRPADLAGVEYYTASQIPAQYRTSGTACGLLILWARK